MSLSRSDPTQRFSNRVEDYARYRPSYPPEVISLLEREAGLSKESVIADVGSGTGISARLFLEHGNVVYGVEPNQAMRESAEELLRGYPRFHSVSGTAEDTTLASHSIDFVVAGQAFHWFDRPKARSEFARILRAVGWVVLMWNSRRTDEGPFAREYEALMHAFGTDYGAVNHKNVDAAAIAQFFAPGPCQLRRLANSQVFDLAGLRGRVISSSFMPAPGHPQYEASMKAVEKLFAAHQRDGLVQIDYDTEIYLGRLE